MGRSAPVSQGSPTARRTTSGSRRALRCAAGRAARWSHPARTMAVIGTTAPTRTSDSRSPMMSISVGAMSDPSRIAPDHQRVQDAEHARDHTARGCSLQHRQGEHLGEHRSHSGHEHQGCGDLWQVDESEQSHGHAGEKGRACDEREWPLRPREPAREQHADEGADTERSIQYAAKPDRPVPRSSSATSTRPTKDPP